MSILRTTRLSMALSFRSGTYVDPTTTCCSTLPCSACLTSVVDMLDKYFCADDAGFSRIVQRKGQVDSLAHTIIFDGPSSPFELGLLSPTSQHLDTPERNT